MHWSALCLVVAGASAAATPERAAAVEEGTDRDGKLFSVFQIVKFNNDACTAVDGTMGTCYTATECTAAGGEERGNCAAGFGVCCVASTTRTTCACGTACAASVSLNNSYLANPAYPSDAATGETTACATARSGRAAGDAKTWTYTIMKAAADIVQLRFDFIDVMLNAPSEGTCGDATLVISGADAVSTKVIPTNLCGDLSGQHLYASVKDMDNVTLTISLNATSTQKWNILVSQFDSTQTDYLAPRGCLQYFRQDIGRITSFNNVNTTGMAEMLNDHMYTICIAQNDDYCDVALTANVFDMDGSAGACTDSLTFGTSQQCGTTFGTSDSLLWNYTGSYNVPFMSDSSNTAMREGFDISYVLLPC